MGCIAAGKYGRLTDRAIGLTDDPLAVYEVVGGGTKSTQKGSGGTNISDHDNERSE